MAAEAATTCGRLVGRRMESVVDLPVLLFVLLATVPLIGCATTRTAPTRGSSPEPAPAAGWSEQGLASWYGEPYHGRATASGDRYDMWDMTAAHRTLPFGSLVRVTNLDNGRSVHVVVNDRGPFVDGRILDLSRAAAETLGAIGSGVVPVRVDLLRAGDGMRDAPCWEVQVGAFKEEANARRAVATLERQGHSVRTAPAGGGLTRVRVTDVGSRDSALSLARALSRSFPGAMPLPCRKQP